MPQCASSTGGVESLAGDLEYMNIYWYIYFLHIYAWPVPWLRQFRARCPRQTHYVEAKAVSLVPYQAWRLVSVVTYCIQGYMVCWGILYTEYVICGDLGLDPLSHLGMCVNMHHAPGQVHGVLIHLLAGAGTPSGMGCGFGPWLTENPPAWWGGWIKGVHVIGK